MTFPNRVAACALAATTVVTISACGSSKKPTAAKPAARPVAQLHAVDIRSLHTIPLGTPVAEVVAKLGTPLRIVHGKAQARKHHKGKNHLVAVTDYYYGVKGAAPNITGDLTFVKGKLSSVLIGG